MIVDVHTHRWESPDELGAGSAQWLRDLNLAPWERPDASVQSHDRAMSSVDYAFILGIRAKHIGATLGPRRIADAVARRPDQYLGFPGIDPTDDACLDELDLTVSLNLSGVTLCPPAAAIGAGELRTMRLLEACAAKKLPVIVHNASHLASAVHGELANPSAFDHALRAFPSLRVMFTGVAAPFSQTALDVIARHEHAYADLSGIVSQPVPLAALLIEAHARGAMNKLFMGSDFPLFTPEKAVRHILGAHAPARSAGVTLASLRAIVNRDALACLGIAKPTPSTAPFDPQHQDNTPDPAAAATGKGDQA